MEIQAPGWVEEGESEGDSDTDKEEGVKQREHYQNLTEGNLKLMNIMKMNYEKT